MKMTSKNEDYPKNEDDPMNEDDPKNENYHCDHEAISV